MNLQQFKKKTESQKATLVAFLTKLDTIVPEDMPQLVAEEEPKIWQETDCLSCANCCKKMTPTYTNVDIKRIAAHLGMTSQAFKKKWLYQEEGTGDWMNVSIPCQFLGKDNKCSIYEVRPLDCAEFPHHNKQPFDAYNDTFTQNLSYCPATYNLVQRLKKRVEKEYEW
jgi:Fe-S-cluster containining protein